MTATAILKETARTERAKGSILTKEQFKSSLETQDRLWVAMIQARS
jgi:hypothetical protein